nr:hypothetical protein [Tanacetum cinerariifolium]
MEVRLWWQPWWDGVGWGGDVVDTILVGDEGDVDGWMMVDLVAGGLAGKVWAAPKNVYREREIVLGTKSMDPSKAGEGETLRSSFVSKIHNVDGKILGNDGKPIRKAVRFQEPAKVMGHESNDQTMKKVAKVSELRNHVIVHGAVVAILLEAVKEVSARFENTLYGYFVGKKLAFPLVVNYVKNTWIKYGLERVMNKNEFFYFQFATCDGIEKVIENGPWLIHSVPLILNVWTPNAQVKRDEIKVVPVWVKLRHGKSDYARALVQVSADVELAKSVVVVIPFLDGTGHSLEIVDVEYEWTPPRCSTCCVFDHVNDNCLKKPIEVITTNKEKDGFTEVKKKKKSKAPIKQVGRICLSKPMPNFYYRHVEYRETSKANVDKDVQLTRPKHVSKEKDVVMKNSFEALLEDETMGVSDETNWIHAKQSLNVINESDSEEVDQVIELEKPMIVGGQLSVHDVTKRESTPGGIESHVATSRLERLCASVFHHWNWTSNALYLEDSTTGSSQFDIFMREFKECVEEIEVMDVISTGLQFTWNQNPKGNDGILKKIDRILANLAFNDKFIGAHAIFMPYRISNHAPAILKIPLHAKMDQRPFKFTNLLVHNSLFKSVVQDEWSKKVSGFYMFQVVKKLKMLKKPFRRLTEEAAYVQAFNDALLMEEHFLKQKAKVNWLKLGDSNTEYFHKVVKSHRSRNRIEAVMDSNGTLLTNDQVVNGFVKHYEAFLGQAGHTGTFNMEGLCRNVLDPYMALAMVRAVSVNEIKDAIFSMGNAKSPGPDGYTAVFFKETWDIIAHDVARVVQEFFQNGKLLKELNHTITALIPKVADPNWINDYRPISCCNMLFKCRRISDNILLTHELMHNYHLDRGAPRCAFKVDIQKARHGYFKGKRGFRQGDPLSSYLFTLIMEVLTLMLHQKVRDSEMFSYHRYCSKLELINLCFADDLFLFAHGDVNSAKVITDALDKFKLASGLTPSLPKSTSYFCNVLNHVKIAILHILPFEEGRLPVKYLGVPLVSSRLVYRDCRELIEKVCGRVMDWKNKSLSAACRLQLIQSVLGSMHIYWASMFIIPSRVLLDVEHIMRGFLWCQGLLKKGKAKVSWDVICRTRIEGGLGIRRLDLFNKPLMVSHLWNLISLKESLWVKWIHVYKLKGRCFLEVLCHGNMTWGWRKILQLFPLIREFIWYRIGDGLKASAWFDSWCHLGLISRIVSSRDIYRACYDLDAKVNELIVNGLWGWPNEWFSKYPLLCLITPPILSNTHDRLEWCTNSGLVKPFSISNVWNSIRPRLKTQDVLRHWDISKHMKALADISNVMGDYKDVVAFLSSHAKRRTCKSVIAKLVFSASVYYISCQLKEVIHSAFRIKLLSCSFKKTRSRLVFAHIWKFPESIFSSKTR